jgi:hypothetical protein
MAWIEQRRRADGGLTARVIWRLGGGRDAVRASETFSTVGVLAVLALTGDPHPCRHSDDSECSTPGVLGPAPTFLTPVEAASAANEFLGAAVKHRLRARGARQPQSDWCDPNHGTRSHDHIRGNGRFWPVSDQRHKLVRNQYSTISSEPL